MDYIDGNIPAEYFEEDFILFEDYMTSVGRVKSPTNENPHAGGDYMLRKFQEFERFLKVESRILFTQVKFC